MTTTDECQEQIDYVLHGGRPALTACPTCGRDVLANNEPGGAGFLTRCGRRVLVPRDSGCAGRGTAAPEPLK